MRHVSRWARLLGVGVLLAGGATAHAQNGVVQGYCQTGGVKVVTQGLSSTTTVQASYPGCTVTAYVTGTGSLATLYSSATGAALPNPFVAATNASWRFWAANTACYDVILTGGTPLALPSPQTLTNVCTGAGGGGSGGVTQIIAGANTTITPTNGVGAVTVNSSGAPLTAAAMQTAMSVQTGCTTAGFAWNPATNTCTLSGGGTSNPQSCTVNTATDKCLGVSPYVAVAGDWSVAINQAMIDLTTTGGNIYGCGIYPTNGTPLDPSGANTILQSPSILGVGLATNATITFNGCAATNPNGGLLNGMTFKTTNNTAGVHLFGGQNSAAPYFTGLKIIFNHVNLQSTGANTSILNAVWFSALETHDVLILGGGGASPSGSVGLVTPSISNNFQIVIDRTGIFHMGLGAIIHEHSQLNDFSVSNNYNGIQFDEQDATGNSIGGTNIWMQQDVNYLLGSSNPASIQLSRVDIESDTSGGTNCVDTSNMLTGTISYKRQTPQGPITKNGCSNLLTFNMETSTFDNVKAGSVYSAGNVAAGPLSYVPSVPTLVSGGPGGEILQETPSNITDQKLWDSLSADGGALAFRAVNDTYTGANIWLYVSRIGFVPKLARFLVPIAGTNSDNGSPIYGYNMSATLGLLGIPVGEFDAPNLSTGDFSVIHVGKDTTNNYDAVSLGFADAGGIGSLLNYEWLGAYTLPGTPSYGISVCSDGSIATRTSIPSVCPQTGGGITAPLLVGPVTAPSGACTVAGAWEFSQDGHATFCSSGSWVTKL